MATSESGYQPRSLQPLIRWAAFFGIALLVARKLLYASFPNLRPTSAWPHDLWWAGLLMEAVFDLILLAFLLGVPFFIFRLRNARTTARDLLIDCAAAASLYATTLFLL